MYLGVRECQGYVEPCAFGEGDGAYDNCSELAYGFMFHGFTYPDEGNKETLYARFWYPVMKRGVIDFVRPEDCSITREIKSQKQKTFTIGKNLSLIEEDVI